jgi:tetratricopeptide (TPR) repeat protein
MAQPAINAKIEELQFRIKTDPKSRLFFPLAEELRRNGRLPEAEQVLRTGLIVHTTYLSAWVSLGRVLREQQKNGEAVEALTTALQVDPGNVVAARLLADCYLDLGQKVEAIKKYKLVQALMPSDEELQAKIDQLDRELRPPEPEPAAPEPAASVPEPEAPFEEPAEPEPELATVSPFDQTTPTVPEAEDAGTDDEIPMAAQHAESPFEEPSGYTAAALEIEQPEGMHIEEAPLVAEMPAVWSDESAADVFSPAVSEPTAESEDVTATTTMADLYVAQGLTGDARKIYEQVLDRDPSNEDVRSKIEALDHEPAASGETNEPVAFEEPPPQPGNAATLHRDAKVVALQRWLDKVARRESPHA